MKSIDLAVVGGGVSGLALAWKAACEGRKVVLFESDARVGGCLHSERTASGFWFEMGAHTTYNSYGAFLDLVVGGGLQDALLERGEARSKFGFLRDGNYRWLTPPRVLLQLNWLEAALYAPRAAFRAKGERSVAEHFGAFVGAGNFKRVLSPFLSAVPSQLADSFPAEGAGSLFKTRPRRKEFIRSFGFEGGLQRVCDAVAATPGITIERKAAVRAVGKHAEGFSIELESGRSFVSRLCAMAAPLQVAGRVLRADFPQLADALAAIKAVAVDSVGVVLPREQAWLPACAFLVPVDDSFFSCVTRDAFPDEKFRAFTFHFRPGLTREARLARVCEILRVEQSAFLHLAEKQITLPAPTVGHAGRVAAIDRALAGTSLAVTGNYFDGLAIEDCVLRSFSEWQRISGALIAPA